MEEQRGHDQLVSAGQRPEPGGKGGEESFVFIGDELGESREGVHADEGRETDGRGESGRDGGDGLRIGLRERLHIVGG